MGTMNELINASAIRTLVRVLTPAAPGVTFTAVRATTAQLGELNLRARSDLVSRALLADLPDDYPQIAAIFRAALADPAFTGWLIWPVTETVATAALAAPTRPRPTRSAFIDGLELLAELTPRLTSEFAIRRFLQADLAAALEVVTGWTAHPDEHVRRLASEGTRQFLPWAIRVPALLAAPTATLPILTALHRDPSEYVRRSVANHLNDLSRQNPGIVTATARDWLAADEDTNTRWVVRHGLRTLIKKADPEALALMGFQPATVSVSALALEAGTVVSPGDLVFTFDVTNEGEEPARLAVDYVIHYLKSNGTHSEKVFKLGTKTVAPGERLTLTKRQSFKPITTRVHYAGEHAVELQINGARHHRTPFHLQL
ncbi:DNA alkylation repair protein [Nakamurella silvestris]|nr:DNA alkylation repair protein [Nakamurella silvestris]